MVVWWSFLVLWVCTGLWCTVVQRWYWGSAKVAMRDASWLMEVQLYWTRDSIIRMENNDLLTTFKQQIHDVINVGLRTIGETNKNLQKEIKGDNIISYFLEKETVRRLNLRQQETQTHAVIMMHCFEIWLIVAMNHQGKPNKSLFNKCCS